MKCRYLMLWVVLAASNAAAETIRNNLPVCASAELLDQTTTAILNHDQPGLDYLLHHGCAPLKPGVRVSVLERNSTLHIRIYSGHDAVEAWTYLSTVYPDGQP